MTHILQRNLDRMFTGLISVALMKLASWVWAIDVGQLRHQLGVGTEPATADDLVRAARLAEPQGAHHTYAPVTAARHAAAGHSRAVRPTVLYPVPRRGGHRPGRRTAHRRGECPHLTFCRIRARVDRAADTRHPARRAVRGDILRFDLGWFIPPVLRYKRVLGEVLGSSLVHCNFSPSPRRSCSQVVIDKVLVHRGMSTLDVLAVALVLLGVFECILYDPAETISSPIPPTGSMSNSARASMST